MIVKISYQLKKVILPVIKLIVLIFKLHFHWIDHILI